MVNSLFFTDGKLIHILYVIEADYGNIMIDPRDDQIDIDVAGDNWLEKFKRVQSTFKLCSVIQSPMRNDLTKNMFFSYNCVEVGRLLTGKEVCSSPFQFYNQLIEAGGKEIFKCRQVPDKLPKRSVKPL